MLLVHLINLGYNLDKNDFLLLKVTVGSTTALCDSDEVACHYKTSYELTALIDSIEPIEHTGESAITIRGLGFGDNKSVIDIDVEGSNCEVMSVANEQITCFLHSAPAGAMAHVRVRVGDKGLCLLSYIGIYQIIMNIINVCEYIIYGCNSRSI